jgi:hypothetical protein
MPQTTTGASQPVSTTVQGGTTTITFGGDPSTNPNGGNTTAPKKTTAANAGGATETLTYNHDIFIVLAIELLAVGLFTLLAGISNDVGKLMVILMIGLWAIYLVTTSSVISGLGSALGKIAQGTTAPTVTEKSGS